MLSLLGKREYLFYKNGIDQDGRHNDIYGKNTFKIFSRTGSPMGLILGMLQLEPILRQGQIWSPVLLNGKNCYKIIIWNAQGVPQ